ncbi:MAG: response regulator receiver protein [uncultured bacterium]|nr:MAG: response regulator receiver protein [uncultured bacterium]
MFHFNVILSYINEIIFLICIIKYYEDYLLRKEVVIILSEDDSGHATLIVRNLRRAGLNNKVIHFKDGQETLNFFFDKNSSPAFEKGTPYLLLLDIRMPKVNGVDVLKKLKSDSAFYKIPVIIITTADNVHEVEECYQLGCSTYITKPVDYEKFIETIKQLGSFLMLNEVPVIE